MPVRDLIGAAALCVSIASGAYTYGKWVGARDLRASYAERKAEADRELFKLADQVSAKSAEIEALQGELNNAIEELDAAAIDAGGGRAGVAADRLRALDRRWGRD